MSRVHQHASMTDWIDPTPPFIPAQRPTEPPRFWLSVLVGSVLIHAGLLGGGSWFWQQMRPKARPEPIEVEMISPASISPKSSSQAAAIAPGKSSQPAPRPAPTPALSPSPAPPSVSQPSPAPPPATNLTSPSPAAPPMRPSPSPPLPTPTSTPTPSPPTPAPPSTPAPTSSPSPDNTPQPTPPGPVGSPLSSPSPESLPGGSPSPGNPVQTGTLLPEPRQGTAGVRLLKVPTDCAIAASTSRQDCYERSAIFKLSDAIDVRYTAPPGFKPGDGIVLDVVMVVGPDKFILEIVSATLAPESRIWEDRPEFSETRLQELAEKIFLGPGWVVEPAQNVRREPDKPAQSGVVENVQSTASVTVELRLP